MQTFFVYKIIKICTGFRGSLASKEALIYLKVESSICKIGIIVEKLQNRHHAPGKVIIWNRMSNCHSSVKVTLSIIRLYMYINCKLIVLTLYRYIILRHNIFLY